MPPWSRLELRQECLAFFAVARSEMEDAMLHELRRCEEPFLFIGKTSDNVQVHAILRWDIEKYQRPRGSASGLSGYAKVLHSHPADFRWKRGYANFRIHVCKHSPCTAMWDAAKYGSVLPPEAHGQVSHVNVPDDASCLLRFRGETQVAMIEHTVMPKTSSTVVESAGGSIQVKSSAIAEHAGESTAVDADTSSAVAEPHHITSSAVAEPDHIRSRTGVQAAEWDQAEVYEQFCKRADEVGKAGTYIGYLEILAFCAIQKRRVMLDLMDGPQDIVSAYAPHIMDESWYMQPFRNRMVACRTGGKGQLFPGSLGSANHFVAVVPVPGKAQTDFNHDSVTCLNRRYHDLGWLMIETVCNGDCGPDSMLILQEQGRTEAHRLRVRLEISAFLRRVAADPTWQQIFINVQEYTCHREAVLHERDIRVHPVAAAFQIAASNSKQNSSPSAVAELKGQGGSSSAVAELGGQCDTAAICGQERSPDRSQGDIMEEDISSEVKTAVSWFSGIPKPGAEMILRLARSLSVKERATVVSAYHEHLSVEANTCRREKETRMHIFKRRYRSTFLWQRDMDAIVFLKWMVKHHPSWKQTTDRVPRGVVQNYLILQSDSALGKSDLQRGRMYLHRAVKNLSKVHNSTSVAVLHELTQSRRHCVRSTIISEHLQQRKRKRTKGNQGRPRRAVWVREELYEWFCNLKRSVVGRIPPAMVMRQAEVLHERYIKLCAESGVPCDGVKISSRWLSIWKQEYRVSLRKPNRRWKVSRSVLLERLRIGWCNIFRVRKYIMLMFGYDPLQINFDQSPYHMNEAGSKDACTLHFRGCGEVKLKEGHAAVRRRWTVNTCVHSHFTHDSRWPWLELMFKADGDRKCAGLQHVIPPEAPWLTVVTSDKGSYRLEHVLDYLEKSLEPWREGRDWRVCWCDAYSAQTADAVTRLCWSRGYIHMCHGGGVTPVVQPPDTDLHAPLRAKYVDMETTFAVAEQQRNRFSLGTPHESDCIGWLAMI